MGKLYEVLSALCEERGITAYRMCKDCEIQPSIMTDLKMERRSSVKAETASKIANYFNVSVDYLLGNEEKPTVKNDELEDDELFAFYGDVKKSLTQADKDDIMALIRIRAELNKNKKG